ncbi:MAG: hypothetical protein ACOY0T_31305, partial [Myxococcota bacterium]
MTEALQSLTEGDFKDAANSALSGNMAAAAGAIAALIVSVGTGHPLAGLVVGKGLEAFARAVVDTATARFKEAGVRYDEERERTLALARELCAGVEPLFARRLDALDARVAEQFLQTIRYMERNVASASGQAELLAEVRSLRALLEALPRRRSARRASEILRPGSAKRPAHLKNPATLLTARYEVVPFIQSIRRRELTELENWCETPEAVRVRLFIGSGGTGKTRLFIESIKRAQREGWDAGFLPESASEGDERDVLEGDKSVLVVVDYAETRRELPRLLASVAEFNTSSPRKIRIALLAREVADWWRVLLGLSAPIADLLNAQEPQTLRPEDIPLDQRRAAFEQSARAFAVELDAPIPKTVPDLSSRRFGRMLYLAMAALGAVSGTDLPPENLLSGTLEHEKRYLRLRYFQDRDPDAIEHADFLDRALRLLAASTLRGSIPTLGETRRLSSTIEGPDETSSRHILRYLHGLYPGRDDSDAALTAQPSADLPYLGALEPDLLGEELVAQVLSAPETPSDYLRNVFDAAPEHAVRQGFMVLGRLGSRSAGKSYAEWIGAVLSENVATRAVAALDAALALASETAHSPLGSTLYDALKQQGTLELARQILPLVPWTTVVLREVGTWATEQCVHGTPEANVEERAGLLSDLGGRLGDLGRREEALAAAEEATR